MEALLISEKFIKDNSAISDNLAGKYIQSSIREAQDIGFRGIVGDTLLDKLKELVKTDAIEAPENADYKRLLDRAQYYLMYTTLVAVVPKVTFKIANAGVVSTPDEKVQVVSQEQLTLERARYQALADSYALDLQNFILNNWRKYPELTEGDYHRIHACLYSAASCGLWLGGSRGKVAPDARRACDEK